MSGPEIVILGADPSSGGAFLTVDEARRIQQALPDAEVAYVIGSGHSIHREKVDILNQVLLTGSVLGEGLASYDHAENACERVELDASQM